MGDAKRLLAARGSPPLDNRELLSSLLDKVEAAPPTLRDDNLAGGGTQSQSQTVPATPMLDNSGLHLVTNNPRNHNCFLCLGSGFFLANDSSAGDQFLFVSVACFTACVVA